MDDAVLIRAASRGDVDAITEIYNEAILTTTATFDVEPKSRDDRLEWFDQHDERHPIFVAEVDGRVVGWVSLSAWKPRAAYAHTVESSFYVQEAYRGRGIGRRLKTHAIDTARGLGYHTIIAGTAEGSDASIHLNESFGFEKVGTFREVGTKFGRRLGVTYYQLML